MMHLSPLGNALSAHFGPKTVVLRRDTKDKDKERRTVHIPTPFIVLSARCVSTIKDYKRGDPAEIVGGSRGSWFIEVRTWRNNIYVCYVKTQTGSSWRD
jgi:hypothetical protein